MKRSFELMFAVAGIASCAGAPEEAKPTPEPEIKAPIIEAGADAELPPADAAASCVTGWCPVTSAQIDARRVYNAVWGTGSSDVWAVGTSGTIAHYDGADWTALASGTEQTLRAVWGSGAGDVWVASTPDLVLHSSGFQNGTATFVNAGEIPRVLPEVTLTLAIWGTDADNVWLGGEAIALDFDRTQHAQAWKRMDPDAGPAWELMPVAKISEPVSLRSYWGSGPDDVWAVGGDDFVVVHEDGSQSVGSNGKTFHGTRDDAGTTQWTELDSQTTAILYAVWGTGGGDVWAVGRRGTIRVFSRGAARWRSVPSPTTENLRGLWGSGPSDIWAVGERGTILHYDGAVWVAAPVPFPADKPNLYGVWGSGPNDIWAVGERGLVHFTGEAL